ncbi:MAG: tetratricopeptide repeat protein [Flammeovirgaceae bacterium]
MAKMIAFPIVNNTEKFGFKPARKKQSAKDVRPGQLNLFEGGKLVSIHQLSMFEEALLLDDHHDKRAKELYLKAIEVTDSVADAYCNLGILESEDKNYSKAINYFTLSLKYEPRHYESHYNLANVYAELGNLLLAKIHYQTSIEIEPTFPNSYFNLGLTLAINKEYALAINTLKVFQKLADAEDCSQAQELISNLERSL